MNANSAMEHRTESDLIGNINVPSEALYGAQTQRALDNFPTANQKIIGDFGCFIKGMLAIKQAAARTNKDLGFLDGKIADAIIYSTKMALKGQLCNQFPIHFLHGGGGTSANMNVNELIANMAEEHLGGKRGQYRIVHPNDHVNMHQSTNDVYPTACHIAIVLQWVSLKSTLEKLMETFVVRANELINHPRIARTCLQDAVGISFGDLLGGYASMIKRAVARLQSSIEELYCLNLGGTIVGRTKDVPLSYINSIVPALAKVMEDSSYYQSENLFDAAQNPDSIAAVSSELAILARGLIKIGKDFRLMGSGPESGFGEVKLPAVQPGSSIMPGKINPVIPEFLIQVGFQVLGYNTACQAAVDHGELDLNVWESVMVFNVLDAMRLLREGVRTFDEKCVSGFTVIAGKNNDNVKTIIPLLTDLMHEYGYSSISNICKKAGGDMKKLRCLLKDKI